MVMLEQQVTPNEQSTILRSLLILLLLLSEQPHEVHYLTKEEMKYE